MATSTSDWPELFSQYNLMVIDESTAIRDIKQMRKELDEDKRKYLNFSPSKAVLLSIQNKKIALHDLNKKLNYLEQDPLISQYLKNGSVHRTKLSDAQVKDIYRISEDTAHVESIPRVPPDPPYNPPSLPTIPAAPPITSTPVTSFGFAAPLVVEPLQERVSNTPPPPGTETPARKHQEEESRRLNLSDNLNDLFDAEVSEGDEEVGLGDVGDTSHVGTMMQVCDHIVHLCKQRDGGVTSFYQTYNALSKMLNDFRAKSKTLTTPKFQDQFAPMFEQLAMYRNNILQTDNEMLKLKGDLVLCREKAESKALPSNVLDKLLTAESLFSLSEPESNSQHINMFYKSGWDSIVQFREQLIEESAKAESYILNKDPLPPFMNDLQIRPYSVFNNTSQVYANLDPSYNKYIPNNPMFKRPASQPGLLLSDPSGNLVRYPPGFNGQLQQPSNSQNISYTLPNPPSFPAIVPNNGSLPLANHHTLPLPNIGPSVHRPIGPSVHPSIRPSANRSIGPSVPNSATTY